MIYKSLYEIGLATPNHSKCESHIENYLPVYENYFIKLRDEPVKLLEIGIGKGGSLRVWKEYFLNGQIWGADFFRDKLYEEERIRTRWCNQHEPSTLTTMMDEIGPCDIIIDDGSHSVSSQIKSLTTLWQYVKSGGIYIIEDLHCSAWSQFDGGYHNGNTIDFLKELIYNINAIHFTRNSYWTDEEYNKTISRKNPYENSPVPEPIPDLNNTIQFLHFYDSLAILGRK